MHRIKKIVFFNMYKMLVINAETFAKNCFYNMIGKKKLRLRNKDIGKKFGVENIYDLIDKEIKGKFKTKIQQMNKSENIKDMDQN